MSPSRDADDYHAWMRSRTLSRRGLFRGLLASGQRAMHDSQRESILHRQSARPPQAIAEPLFLQSCDGCAACRDSCPMGIIVFREGKPEINIEFAECDFCAACTQACTRGALMADIAMDTGLRPGISDHCLGRLDNLCRMCEIACPRTAIFFNQHNQPAVDHERCNGCGKCKLVCYHGDINLSLQLS